MFDEELVMMATKDLNSLLKKRNVAKHRQKDIKQRRRTLKNRYGYEQRPEVIYRVTGYRSQVAQKMP